MKIIIETTEERPDYTFTHEGIENPRDTVTLLADALTSEACGNASEKATEDSISEALCDMVKFGVHEFFREKS